MLTGKAKNVSIHGRISILLNFLFCLYFLFLWRVDFQREAKYQEAIRKRDLKLTETHKMTEYQKTPDIWFLYEPLWSCPDIELVGTFHDGIKWVCELRKLRKGCVIYSFGSNGDDQFERDIIEKTYCKVFTFDPTLSYEKELLLSQKVRENFHKIGLAAEDGLLEIGGVKRNVQNLKSIMNDMKHKRIDILKIDIEGFEYDVFEQLSSTGFPYIGQILVEVHAFNNLQFLNKSGSVLEIPSKLRLRLDRLFQNLEGAGFRLFHKEINVLWSRPFYSNMGVEYCFLNSN